MIFDSLLDEYIPEIKTEAKIDCFPKAEIPRVIIVPQVLLSASG
jgi:hypothetical protein